MHKNKEGDGQRKKKTLSEVKPMENISKNMQSFLEISLVQKEFLLHKILDSFHIKGR